MSDHPSGAAEAFLKLGAEEELVFELVLEGNDYRIKEGEGEKGRHKNEHLWWWICVQSSRPLLTHKRHFSSVIYSFPVIHAFPRDWNFFLEKRKLRVKKVGFVFFALLPNAYGTKLVFFRCSILVGNFYWKLHFDGMHYKNTFSKIRIVVVVCTICLLTMYKLFRYTLQLYKYLFAHKNQ